MRRFYLCLFLVVMGFSSGCGGGKDYGPTGTVTGTVLLEGKPLQPGTTVVFQHEEKGYLAYGQTDEQGNYNIRSWNAGNLPVGQYAVTIQPALPPRTEESIEAHDLIENPALIEETIVKLDFPERYRDALQSNLRFGVQQGVNHYEIQLDAAEKTPTHAMKSSLRDR